MRAHQLMTNPVFTVLPDATILEAANLMLRRHISGLPVVDAAGKLVGIVSEGDFIRRSEIGTQRRRSRLLKLILTLQLPFCFEVGSLGDRLMSSTPE
jgi:CBS domain-containing protein